MIVLTLRGTRSACDKALVRLAEVLDIHGEPDICPMQGIGTPGFDPGIRLSVVVTVAEKDPEPTDEQVTAHENEAGEES